MDADFIDDDLMQRNLLLRLLDPATRAALAPHLQRVPLVVRERLYEVREPPQWAYFPLSGVVSMVAEMPDSPTSVVEVATVGHEGMIGLPIFLGADLTPGFAFAQVPGEALRLPAGALREATAEPGRLSRVLHRYTQAMLSQVYQATACNRVHTVHERCARWFLQTHDRVGADEFELAAPFVAQMLGEPVAVVRVVTAMLQQAGFIRYDGDRLTVTDRRGLEGASCGCYRIVADEYERMAASA
ncbi:MAG: Crp/Fnr family transcriptional regulator [Rubrivivax sp.]|nr:MAG: Crp/Fnr family transcriptional regulator [Rubrivivax sp.]